MYDYKDELGYTDDQIYKAFDEAYVKDLSEEREAMGRELFSGLRQVMTTPEEGASCVFHDE